MSAWEITRCAASELAEVVELVNAAYRGEGGQSGWTSEIGLVDGPRTTIEALRADLESSREPAMYLLRDAAELLACVRLERARTADGQPACYISMLTVRPGRQDRGLGRVMLEHAEATGRAGGAQIARMSVVSVRESLIAWYERRGYRRTGETEPFPRDTRFGEPQRPDLEFIMLEKDL